jgi:hypothetical protein
MKFLRLAPAIVVALAACLLLRLWASGQTMWLDEEMIALNVRDRQLGNLPGLLWLGQTAPLGWLVLQRLMLVTFGTSELALRVVPVLFGIGTLMTAVWIGRRWMSPIGATILALLCGSGYWLMYYSVELKQFSADAFWALLLPALAAAAAERPPNSLRTPVPRIIGWWATAAIGQWFGVGAVLVTPGCALVLLATVLRRDGWRVALNAALPGVGWLIFFGLHYLLSLQYAVKSQYLRDYWGPNMAPAATGIAGALGWLVSQLQPLAVKPGGAEWWGGFWLAAAIGFVLSWKRSGLGLFFGSVVVSGFLWAAFRLVPLSERVALWMMPALYVGIALCVDGATRMAHRAYVARRWLAVGAASLVSLMGLTASLDIFRGGYGLLHGRPGSDHQLDDRSAVQWLMSQRRAGDAVLTTHNGLPAIWWYGSIPIGTPGIRGGQHPDGGAILEVKFVGEPCSHTGLGEALDNERRVLVYLGWIDDRRNWVEELVTLRLKEIGKITDDRNFERSRVLIVERHPDVVTTHDPAPQVGVASRQDGCLHAVSARRPLVQR